MYVDVGSMPNNLISVELAWITFSFDWSLLVSRILLPDFVENEHFCERFDRGNLFVLNDMEMLDESSTCEFKTLTFDAHGDSLEELFMDLFSGSTSS